MGYKGGKVNKQVAVSAEQVAHYAKQKELKEARTKQKNKTRNIRPKLEPSKYLSYFIRCFFV
jgi:hypothetical protein